MIFCSLIESNEEGKRCQMTGNTNFSVLSLLRNPATDWLDEAGVCVRVRACFQKAASFPWVIPTVSPATCEDRHLIQTSNHSHVWYCLLLCNHSNCGLHKKSNLCVFITAYGRYYYFTVAFSVLSWLRLLTYISPSQ